MARRRSRGRSRLATAVLSLGTLVLTLTHGALALDAPDLELVALQTTGPGRIGDCNAVVARLLNSGTAPTAGAPEVRLDVHGAKPWSRTVRAPAPLDAGATVEVWFHRVPLEGGRLTLLEATADPSGVVRESVESNNARSVHREPRVACGVTDADASPGGELRVRVRRPATETGSAAAAGGAAVEVSSPLGAGAVIARGETDDDGSVVLSLPPNQRSPVLRVTVTVPGCAPQTRLATLAAAPSAVTDVDLEVSCAPIAEPAREIAPGVLEIEAALPGLLRIDDLEPVPVTPGARLAEHRPGARVRVRATSAGGLVFHDETVAVPRDRGVAIVVDAPPLLELPGADAVEDLRSGLTWTAGATAAASLDDAAAACAALERAGATDWRLPTIDELAFVAGDGTGDGDAALQGLRGLSPCCLWSTTEHAVGGTLTLYLDGGHIYGRRPQESGIGALCVRGTRYVLDPLLVPQRYRDRLPGQRRFSPTP